MIELRIIKNSFLRIVILLSIVALFVCSVVIFVVKDTANVINEVLIILSFGILILTINSFPIYKIIGRIVFEESRIQVKFIDAEDKSFKVNKDLKIVFDDRGFKGALHSSPFLGIPLFQKDGICNLYLSDGLESISIKILIRKHSYRRATMLINKYKSISSS